MTKISPFKPIIFAVMMGLLALLNACHSSKKSHFKKPVSLKNQQDSTKYYDYKIIYPDSVYFRQIADTLQHYAHRQKKEFIKAQPPDTSDYNVTPYELRVEFKRAFHSPDFVSYTGNFYQFTGGAHGMSVINTFNYDKKKKQFIELPDLFRDTTALKPISRYAKKRIAKKIYRKDSDAKLRPMIRKWVKEGAAPVVRNYRFFHPAGQSHHSATGLKIIFSPYQVGPHAIGIPHIVIPDSVFYDELNPDYQHVFKKPK